MDKGAGAYLWWKTRLIMLSLVFGLIAMVMPYAMRARELVKIASGREEIATAQACLRQNIVSSTFGETYGRIHDIQKSSE
jgi:hypothetical protein